MEFYNKHYIAVDERNRIVNGFSDAFRQPSATDICINDQGGYQFRLFPDGVENPALFDWNGVPVPLYKWENGEVVKRTAEEIEADRVDAPDPEPTKTTEERLSELETSKANQSDVDELTEALELLLSGDTGEVATDEA